MIVPGSTLCRKSSRYFLLVKVSYSCCVSYEWQFKATDVLSVVFFRGSPLSAEYTNVAILPEINTHIV